MPKFDLPITTLALTLEDDTHFVEALLFPQVIRYHSQVKIAQASLRANLKKILDETDARDLHRLALGGQPQTGAVTFVLEPSADKLGQWRRPIELSFQTVSWEQGEAARIVYVPALEIEIVAATAAQRAALDKLVERHIRGALARDESLKSLLALLWWDRFRAITLATETVEALVATPKQSAARDAEAQERKQSALTSAATDLTQERHTRLPNAFEVEEDLARLAETLTGRTQRSALLVGPSGVGKTALVYELVRRRAWFGLGHTPFWETSGARLVAGMSGFGQWQERCRRIWQELAAARAILYLGNLIELTEVGKSVGNEQSIGAYLRPLIARGDVWVIAECTPEQAALIERTDPRLLAAFEQIKLAEPDEERAKAILLDVATARPSAPPTIDFEALERLHHLHRRYAGYSAQPGRTVRFLRRLLDDRASGHTITPDEINEAFSRETGLPRVLIDERERLDAETTRAWFTARVAGQTEAVALVVDLLLTIKAGLVRPRKPIASLLFIGPTGVGKTEMAKALAEFLFQDRGRMIRFDMSEYATPGAVSRLIGNAFGGSEQEGLLTAKVREQPFAVLLLDELEKAHPSMLDLLLQVLGEGRLTDAQGRVADFSNTVVIMTSNLGATSFQRASVGFNQPGQTPDAARQAAARHFTTAVRKALRPEMFNRIDRIVPFAPLDRATVLSIAARELERIKLRDGLRFGGVALKLSAGVIEHLAERGYSPRYGARPLKRAIERELLVPLADQLNGRAQTSERKAAREQGGDKQGSDEQGSNGQALPEEATVSLEGGELRIHLRANLEQSAAHPPSERQQVAEMARLGTHRRREFQAFKASPSALELHNEIFRLRRLREQVARATKAQRKTEEAQATRLNALPELERTSDRIAALEETINALEHDLLFVIYGLSAIDAVEQTALQRRCNALSVEWRDLLLTVYARRFPQPHEITLAFFCDDKIVMGECVETYHRLLTNLPARVTAARLIAKPGPPKTKKKEPSPLNFERVLIRDLDQHLMTWPDETAGLLGLLLHVSAPFAFARLQDERGLHVFEDAVKPRKVLIETSEQALLDYTPPEGLKLHGFIGPQPVRRIYDLAHLRIEDKRLDRTVSLKGREPEEAMAELIEAELMRAARTLIE